MAVHSKAVSIIIFTMIEIEKHRDIYADITQHLKHAVIFSICMMNATWQSLTSANGYAHRE